MLRAVPELPEVETIRRGVSPHVVGRRIEAVTVREPRLRWPVPPDLAARVVGRTVTAVNRRGKYLLFELDRGRLLIHLGMSGRLYVLTPQVLPIRHDHLDLHLSGGLLLRFHDPRRFGAVLPLDADGAEHPLLASMGPEPLSDEFSADYLYGLSRGRVAPVKNFLMDGRVVVGVGNIYASESLFRAGIRPGLAAGRVSRPRYARLEDAVRETLQRAIGQGGTTLRDFSGAHGEAGYFQQELMVYGREGQACRNCDTAIRRLVIGQRSSFFCPQCQR